MGCMSSSATTTLVVQQRAMLEAPQGKRELLVEIMNKQEVRTKRTVAHWACFANNFTVLKILLAHGADVTIRDAHNFTCLHEAAKNCSYECLVLLLELRSIEVEAAATYAGAENITPLQLLVTQVKSVERSNEERIKCIKLLRSRGADPLKSFTLIEQRVIKTPITAEFYAVMHFKGEYSELQDQLRSNAQMTILAARKAAAEAKQQKVQDVIDTKAAEHYALFVAEVAERTMRIVVRVKNVALMEEANAAMKAQILKELGELPRLQANPDNLRTQNVNGLAALLADEIVLMVDDQGAVEANVLKPIATAFYKQLCDAEQAKVDALNAKVAAIGAASAAAVAAITGAAAGGSNKDTMNPLVGNAVDAAGDFAAGQAIDAITGLIPLPFAGAIIGAGVKMAIKKTASAATSGKS